MDAESRNWFYSFMGLGMKEGDSNEFSLVETADVFI